MIRADREVLGKLSAVNQHMGEIVMDLLTGSFDGDELPPDELRRVACALKKLSGDLDTVADAMTSRADEIAPAPATIPALEGPSHGDAEH